MLFLLITQGILVLIQIINFEQILFRQIFCRVTVSLWTSYHNWSHCTILFLWISWFSNFFYWCIILYIFQDKLRRRKIAVWSITMVCFGILVVVAAVSTKSLSRLQFSSMWSSHLWCIKNVRLIYNLPLLCVCYLLVSRFPPKAYLETFLLLSFYNKIELESYLYAYLLLVITQVKVANLYQLF